MSDDEITIDFGKIASKFKSKEKPKKTGAKKSKQSDEEISVDFGKITSIFKSKEPKRPSKSEGDSEEEVSIDLSKIKNVFKPGKSRKADDELSLDFGSLITSLKAIDKYKVFLLLLIPIILSIHLRMQPAYLPITEDWAADSVFNYYKSQIRAQVDQQYPNLPDANKNELVNENFKQLQQEQGALIKQQIEQTSNQFKQEFKDENGQTYLLAIDPYFWLRFVENIDKNGHYGDELRDGKPYDNHFMAPIGRFVGGDDFHIHFEYYLYKILRIFDGDMYPMKAAFLAPVIISALSIIPAFFIARKIGGDTGGFFAAMMVAIHPAFLTRTVGGFADTDAYNIFFPLLITWLFLEAFETKDSKKTILLSAISGFFVGMYSAAWGGWWYIFDFLIGLGILYFCYYVFLHKKDLKNKGSQAVLLDLFSLIISFTLASMVFVVVFHNFDSFKMVYNGPLFFTRMKEVGSGGVWPNVYTTVAEQNPQSLNSVINNIGGRGMLFLAVIGIALTMLKKDKHGKIDIRYALLLTMWFFATMYASTKGVRFLLLFVPAFGIAFGSFAGVVIKYLSVYFSNELKIDANLLKLLFVFVMLLLLITPMRRAQATAKQEVPSMNDAWVRSLTQIKINSSEDAIINSWWDFGHWFKYFADRRVTFDGTSQNIPQAHWIGRTLLTDSEDEAIAILRMLDCGGNTAFTELDSSVQDPLKSVIIIKRAILMGKDEARDYLSKYTDDADKIIELTHCEPPEDYFITSEDMVGKSGVWAHFGSWNFTKADMVWRVKPRKQADGVKILMDRYGMDAQKADKIYYEIQTQAANDWIAPWPSYASNLISCSVKDELVSCGNGLKFNLTSEEAYVDTSQGRLRPASFSFVDFNGDFKEIKYEEDLILSNTGEPLGAALISEGNSYGSVLMANELTSSMFTRLFYFNGVGLQHFEAFHFDRDITGLDIYVWKVNWEGQ